MTQIVSPQEAEADDLRARIVTAIDLVLKNDNLLLENTVNERSVSHKLAEYLQQLFPEWHVDCEYDRDGSAVKQLEGISECSEDRATDRVLPDIIIHLRATDHNLVVIEVKTKDRGLRCDKKKLELFTSDAGRFQYQLGVSISFKKSGKPEILWFEHGKTVSS